MKYIVNKTINIDRNEISSIKAVENDMNTRFIKFQLLTNNQPLDLTGLTVRVYGKTSKGTEVFNDLNIIDSAKGLVELELTRPFLVEGITEYQLKIYTSDNGVLSSNILLIDVTKDLMSNNSIEASNEYTAIEKAFKEVDNSIDRVNETINNSVNRVNESINSSVNRINTAIDDIKDKSNQTINNLTDKVNEAIEKTKPQELAKEILNNTISSIKPTFSSCNDFKEPNKYFTFDTSNGGFRDTPLGDLEQYAGVTFEVINYGTSNRIIQEFKLIYPASSARSFYRNFTAGSNVWTDWRNEFIESGEIGGTTDFNTIINMGCYKVEGLLSFMNNTHNPLRFDNNIGDSGLLIVYKIGVGDNASIVQTYYHYTSGNLGIPVTRMRCKNIWTNWSYIYPTSKDIDRLTSQIASNGSSISDLYCWVNRNIGMQYISGATSLTLQPNWSYYLDGQHVADITHIDHSAIRPGEKVYFFIASGDPLAHIVFRRNNLCTQDVRVWLPKGQDFWIVGDKDGDRIFTLMKIGDAMRFLN